MEYATISDAWGDTFCKKNKIKPSPRKVYDNIIDSYIDDFDKSKSMKINHKIIDNNTCNKEVKPFSNESQFMSYDEYFSTTNLFAEKEKMQETRNDVPELLVKEEENFSNNSSDTEDEDYTIPTRQEHSTYPTPKQEYSAYTNMYSIKKTNYIDLILYVVSGIFLIFMFEQILNIAKVMKS